MDDKKDAPEAEDAAMQQSYPSPIVDSADAAQYYEQLAQHRELEPQMDHHQQPAQPEHHGLPAMPEHQDQHDEHHDLHQLQGLQDSPAPQQQNARPPVSVDELQLAAQLTQGLAPMMAAAVQDQAQEQQPMQQQDGQEGQMQPHAEPNLQEQLEASLQDHERELQSHEHELQGHSHDLQDHELQDVLPHPDQPQQHHYGQNPPPPPHLPHHMSMEHLSQAHPQQYQLPDATPPRKRSKVSRACDECRRKKIKCDAQSEANEQPCSNCRRSNAQCLFSRVPQKRGPSKGYIKELADRINTIEGRLSTNVEGLERRPSSEAFASPGLADDSRKRPFASISGDGFQTPSPNRISSAFSTDHKPILPYPQPDFPSQMPANPTDLSMNPPAPMQYPGTTNDIGMQGQSEIMDSMSQNGLPQGSSHQADQLPEIEDAVFNRYLEVIHPTFPVLASSKARVQSLLWQSPLGLQNAFYNAFFSMVKHFLPDSSGQMEGDPATTCRFLNEWDSESKPRSPVTDLVRLQALIMAVISVDCHGIASAKGQLGGPSKVEILARAVGLGYSMKVHLRTVDPNLSPELDPNSDDNVALRAWWVLVMLDRWNALGMATPTLIADNIVVPQPGLKHIVGEVVFALIRTSYAASYVFSLLIPLIFNSAIDPLSQQSALLGPMTTGVTQVLAWVFPTERTDPVLHLAYWHARLLSELLSPDVPHRPSCILRATKTITNLLGAKHDLLSPVTHHFTTLAALGLLELHRFDETREEAARLTREVLDYSIAPSPWNAAVRDKLAAYQARVGAAGLNASQNLQQLADLATAVDGSAAAAPDAGDGQPREEPLGAGASNGAAVQADGGAAISKPEEPKENGHVQQQQALVDVRALLRDGYLAWVDEPNEHDEVL